MALNDDGTVVEVHQASSATTLWSRVGHLDAAGEITWSASARYDTGVLPTIAFTDRAGSPAERIRYPQVAFVEYQAGDGAELKDGSLFWAATASDKSFIVSALQAGVSARGWDFDSASLATDPLANFPATNTPNAAWYQTLLSQASAVA